MNRIIRPVARAIALLLAGSLGSQAFAVCNDITFSFDNTTGTMIRVIKVRYFDATTGVSSNRVVSKDCFDTYTCVTPATNLGPVAPGDNIASVRFQYRPWVGGGWGAAIWTGVNATVVPQCVDHRNYGTWAI